VHFHDGPPIGKDTFLDHAEPLKLTFGGKEFELTPREFKTGSLGWNATFRFFFFCLVFVCLFLFSGQVTLTINNKRIPVQMSLNAIVAGSKPEESG
jgi:hypothetical protein